MTQALGVSQAGDTLHGSAGNYAGEGTVTVGLDNLTISIPAAGTGLALQLGAGVDNIVLAGDFQHLGRCK